MGLTRVVTTISWDTTPLKNSKYTYIPTSKWICTPVGTQPNGRLGRARWYATGGAHEAIRLCQDTGTAGWGVSENGCVGKWATPKSCHEKWVKGCRNKTN